MESQTFKITPELLASQGERFINYLIDFIVQYALLIGIGIVVLFISEMMGSSAVTDYFGNMNTGQEYLLGFLTAIVYYGLCETYFSRTIGKLVTKTIVVMEDGSKPDAITILKRSFCRIIPFDGLSFLGSRSRGWHDTIPNVYVVKKQAMEDSRALFHSFEEIGNAEA